MCDFKIAYKKLNLWNVLARTKYITLLMSNKKYTTLHSYILNMFNHHDDKKKDAVFRLQEVKTEGGEGGAGGAGGEGGAGGAGGAGGEGEGEGGEGEGPGDGPPHLK